MNVVFRADASLQIGTGHVMRCLTLADALAERGASCQFICREQPGHLIEWVRAKGHVVHALPVLAETDSRTNTCADQPAHHHWLGATQAQDADACTPIVAAQHPDWLIVDHYALDACWEAALKPHCRQLMVIDDLADRPHVCDLLLDQTFGRNAHDYRHWVPADCHLCCGSQFALLRPEFAAFRAYSLQRRAVPQLRELLITMGGVDQDNATGKVLQALRACALPAECRITVVMGTSAPWLAKIKQQALRMPWPTQVLVGVSNMAQLMADSDLAIGAAGATSWERCCLGLPTVMMAIADNQTYAARLLEEAKAVCVLDINRDLANALTTLLQEVHRSDEFLRRLGEGACKITDGKGVRRIADRLLTGAFT
ncbi:MAG: UDP-2,4-diacetamido-2,4,6-trideoxy-beta-L-altropyranose hydrolase [Hydrogenophaga sp.]|nr:UDP-2,4-diacetamido-2,4,6-trideoxy-beta-L-altropyranose hydrolase [Hydrogenophaga sp.]